MGDTIEAKDRLPPDLAEVVAALRKGLQELYGERFRDLLLYGSYARGDQREGSDVDLLALLDGPVDTGREILRIESIVCANSLDHGVVPTPVVLAPAGPLFGLPALVNNLGGTLVAADAGESFTLTIDGKEVVLGVGSAIITVGENSVSLSQPLTHGEGTLLVPLDFLRKTFGDLAGFTFDWRKDVQQLVISRPAAREIPVLIDVVHLQGMTTLVLQFPETPRYQVVRRASQIDVQMLGNRLAPPPTPLTVSDPLVQSVTITPEQVRIQLTTGAQASNYVLENPFRIVFDVHLPAQRK